MCKTPKVIFLTPARDGFIVVAASTIDCNLSVAVTYDDIQEKLNVTLLISFFYAFFVSFCRKILISLDMFVNHVIRMMYLAFFLF